MLRLFRWLFGRKSAPKGGPDEYAFVLTLADGATRRYDPWEVEDRFRKALPDWREQAGDLIAGAKDLPPGTPAAMAKAREERLAATERALTAAVSVVFGLPPLAPDGTGFTRQERLEALGLWVVWSGSAKEIARPLASGGEPTGGTSASASAAPSPPANATA